MRNLHLLLCTSLLAATACGSDSPATPDAPTARPIDAAVDAPIVPPNPCGALVPSAIAADPAWYGTNRADLTAWLDAGGCQHPGYDAAHKPIVLFDWDNTISKNDFGDAITFWFIANDKVLQPPGQDWHATSPYMTDAGAAALTAACGTTVAAGLPLPTSTNTACADEMLKMYNDEVTRGGQPAWAGANLRQNEPAYAWTAQLLAGYTHAQIAAFTLAAVTPQLAAAQGTTQTIGTTTGLNAWLRITAQQQSLIAAATSRGFDVWVITASPQDVIGAVAPMAGIPTDHVVGIRSLTDGAGKLTYRFEGCGVIPDGQGAMIPTIQGKRCWVNKGVFGDTTAKAIQRRPEGHRQYLAVADTDSDVEFMRDATYKFVINRNKGDMMCHAYYNEGDSWRINPMFILPKPMKATPYPCSTTTFTTETGASQPSRDEGGNIIPDQIDRVYP
jgi:hypothetical protein